jgi:ABC-type transport system involved in multi-copper enzyme maturation permease subunit
MIGRILIAYRAEVRKALRKKFGIISLFLVILTAAGTCLLRPVVHDGAGDYAFIAYSTSVALNLLGLFLMLTFCASSVSSEVSRGSVCLSLVRPVRRYEYIAAKVLLGLSYAAAMIAGVAGVSWAIAFAFGDLSGVSYGGEVLYTNSDMAISFMIGGLLAVLPYFAVVSFAVMISTGIGSTAGSIGAALGTWIVADLLKYPLHIGKFWFSTYIETPWQMFSGRCNGLDPSWWPDTGYAIGVSLAWGTIFTLLAMYFMSKRDLKA